VLGVPSQSTLAVHSGNLCTKENAVVVIIQTRFEIL